MSGEQQTAENGEQQEAATVPENNQEPEFDVITIGEETPPSEENDAEKAPEWVRKVRESNRELNKRVNALEKENDQLRKKQVPEEEVIVLGKKPQLEDFDFDAAKFDTALSEWYTTKAKKEAQEQTREQKVKQQQQQWQATVDNYENCKKKLRIKDFEEAENTCFGSISELQKSIIIAGAENPAALVAALGARPEKLKELASITDPIKFSFAVAKIEGAMKITQKKPGAPEQIPSGVGSGNAVNTDQTEKALEAEAEKTGDYTKLFAHRKKVREAAKKK